MKLVHAIVQPRDPCNPFKANSNLQYGSYTLKYSLAYLNQDESTSKLSVQGFTIPAGSVI